MGPRLRVILGAITGLAVFLAIVAWLISLGGPWALVFILAGAPFELILFALLSRDGKSE